MVPCQVPASFTRSWVMGVLIPLPETVIVMLTTEVGTSADATTLAEPVAMTSSAGPVEWKSWRTSCSLAGGFSGY